jgi:glutathione peroxidase
MQLFKNKILKGLLITTGAVLLLLLCTKQTNMTVRQSLLKAFYPVIMGAGKLFGAEKNVLQPTAPIMPEVPIYTLTATTIDGKEFNFNQCKGKKILIVNTASDCGYTGQYEELEKLYQQYKDKLIIIGFPANDFKEQEKANNTAIAGFCKVNFGVTFLLMQKASVISSNQQHPVFQWLCQPQQNGWNNQQPQWNFSKYLINQQGQLMAYFPSGVSPLSDIVVKAIQQ